MRIVDFYGIELEKERGSFQDYFNESFVRYREYGEERVFSVLYLRYFEEQFAVFTPFRQNPIFEYDGKPIYIKDIVAFVYLLSGKVGRDRKRVYIHDGKAFSTIFEGMNEERLLSRLRGL